MDEKSFVSGGDNSLQFWKFSGQNYQYEEGVTDKQSLLPIHTILYYNQNCFTGMANGEICNSVYLGLWQKQK